ncbi:MAG TPA: DedA family protein, partial [Bacillota bacterium]|nr:DedA family protein [Bacillota bacterium]
MEFWLNYIEQAQYLTKYSYLLILMVLVFSFLEVVVPPIPGDTVLVLGSSLAAAAGVAPVWLIISASVGTFGASLICYRLGNSLGEKLFELPRFSRLLDAEMFHKIKHWFERYGYWTLLISRMLPVARSGIVLAAGIVNFERRRALTALSLSIVISSTLFVMAGYLLGNRWRELYRLWV